MTLKPRAHYPSIQHKLVNLLADYGLTQHIHEQTYLRNTLDLIANNMPDQTYKTQVIPGISDYAIS